MKRRIIRAAEDENMVTLDDQIKQASDDFDYIVAGLEKLERSGAKSTQDAEVILEDLNTALQGIISKISELM